ncbi:hypothetical protein DFH07DRAFT_819578 [Mycena maculata]|uniref:DUF6535 domain-containing protein n=1 Tax=Mycena maculata TaxID=230809 RepID=A0AAD7NEQ0_9AGAR|nr:hypothetical protein DFH07DRAFT_819578 [Mycena maculata]
MADQELEAGLPRPQRPTKDGSVLHRVASAAFRVLRPRQKQAGRDPKPPESLPPTPDGQEKGNYSEAENEEACTKIWSIYVGEAERYDAALVESWRADMEGMLIFSGLFSASLTAFLIESYKNLQQNSGDQTVTAILQVSQQLAAIANGESYVSPKAAPFVPPTESLWCNAFWFISLSLSLTCALLATLVEQWAREFLHKTEMRPSPVRRARIFSFLYFGLQRFRIHTIVDAIPFLLHASLLLFFAGLVAFLMPVNRTMMYLMGIALFIFLLLYTVLTVLPVLYLDCPYRTPVSAPLWSLLRNPLSIFGAHEVSPQPTMTEAVVHSALRDSENRDQRALQWTLDSLTDDVELLPFVEAIPDIIHGPNGFRRLNDHLFIPILGDIEIASPLVTRICNLIKGTRGMALDDPLRTRRRVAGHKALWALCMMPCAWDRHFDVERTRLGESSKGLPATALLAIMYHAQRWSHHLVGTLRDLLVNHDHSSPHFREEVLPMALRLLRLLVEQEELFVSPFAAYFTMSTSNACSRHFAELKGLHTEIGDSVPTAVQLAKTQCILAAVDRSHDWASNSIVLIGEFLRREIEGFHNPSSDPLFEPLVTCNTILSEIEFNPPIHPAAQVYIGFPSDIRKLEYTWPPKQLDVLARIAFRLLRFLPPEVDSPLSYLRFREEARAIGYALGQCDLLKLSQILVGRLSDEGKDNNIFLRDDTVAIITTVANCIRSDSEAIVFVDKVLASSLSAFVSEHSAIRAARYLRHLRKFSHELSDIPFLPQSTAFHRLQEICQDELLNPLRPLFLPRDVDMQTVIDSLRIHLFNKYILFLSDYLKNTISISAEIKIYAFNRVIPFHWWDKVDPEIQDGFFAAILAKTESLIHTENNKYGSDLVTIGEQLWSSDLFWMEILWEGRSPHLYGIQPSCLQLLVESLGL